jgi:hypothetical protein
MTLPSQSLHDPDDLRTPLKATAQTLAQEVKTLRTSQLADYLSTSRRPIKDLYRASNSWTTILCRAGLAADSSQPGEADLLKRVHAFLHVDDAERVRAYDRLLGDDAPSYDSLGPTDQTFARMLFFNLWDKAGGFSSYAQGFESLRGQRAFRSELRQVLAYSREQKADYFPIHLGGAHAHIPLKVHSEYNRSEILAAMGVARLGGQMPGFFAQGVLWDEANRTDALLITLQKNERDFSPTVRYKDYAESRTQFHWESQSTTANTSPTGLRYQQHAQRGSHVLLFMRRHKDTDIGKAQPWILLGPATYESHTGSKPMAVRWRLDHELPADVWAYASTAMTNL